MKYKVGDKVRIKSNDWYNENKNEYGDVGCRAYNFTYGMAKFCGEIVTIHHCYAHDCYTIKEDSNDYTFTGEMIEGFAEAKFKPNDIVDTNDNLYGYITDDIEYDQDKKSFKYYVSFIVDGGYYYEYQLKPHKSNKEQMKETNYVCANAIAGNIIAEKDMLSIALSNGLILPKCANKDLEKMDIGDVSDGYHTFNELYDYRALYNAAFFNSLAVYVENMGDWVVDCDVHKSKKHSDGEDCFGGGWFIVMAELPTGQISNHYPMKDWDIFHIPEKEKANKWDGHTPQDVAKRMREFLTPKPKYPKTYEECCKILDWNHRDYDRVGYKSVLLCKLQVLLLCRDAYWKIAGEEMGLGKPWEPGDNKVFGIIRQHGKIQKYNDLLVIVQYLSSQPKKCEMFFMRTLRS